MEDFTQKPNKFQKEKEQRVVSGTAKTKKKKDINKLKDAFIAEDASSVKNYVIWDVIVPSTKKMISEAIKSAVDIVFGNGRDRGRSNTNASKVSYRNYYDDRRNERREVRTYRNRGGYAYDDIILDSLDDANEVLNRMEESIKAYGIVSVGDLFDLAGLSANYTDYKYGWTDLHNAYSERVSDGYILRMPRALPLD